MVPVSWWLIQEPRVVEKPSLRSYLVTTLSLLRSRAMFYVVLYQFLTPVIGNISTTRGGGSTRALSPRMRPVRLPR